MHFMEAKTKKMIFFIGAIFVGIIFLTSYAAFGNNGSATTVTSTVAAVSAHSVCGGECERADNRVFAGSIC